MCLVTFSCAAGRSNHNCHLHHQPVPGGGVPPLHQCVLRAPLPYHADSHTCPSRACHRNGWCDGQDVKLFTADITSQLHLHPGSVNRLRYRGLFRGEDPHPQLPPGVIMMQANLVLYQAAAADEDGGMAAAGEEGGGAAAGGAAGEADAGPAPGAAQQ